MIISALKTLNVEKTSTKLTAMITSKHNVIEVSKRTWWAADQLFQIYLTLFTATFNLIIETLRFFYSTDSVWSICFNYLTEMLFVYMVKKKKKRCPQKERIHFWYEPNNIRNEHLLTLFGSSDSPLLPSDRRTIERCPLPTVQRKTSQSLYILMNNNKDIDINFIVCLK